jgi:hypothetical protein
MENQNVLFANKNESYVVKNNPFVPVFEKPFNFIVSNEDGINEYQGIKGIDKVIVSNGKVVNVCSGDYGLLTNKNFFGAFEKHLQEEHINFTVKYRNINDKQFTADYILDGSIDINPKFQNRYKDIIQPKIRLINSYDGNLKTAAFVSFFRQVCSNGLHALRNELAFSLKHRSNIVELSFPSLTTMLNTYRKSEGINVIRRFEVLAESPVNTLDVQDIIKKITEQTNIFKFEKSDKNEDMSINAKFVYDVVNRETTHFNIKPNAWIIYNAFNEWIHNEERNQKTETKRNELDTKVFQTIEKLVLN